MERSAYGPWNDAIMLEYTEPLGKADFHRSSAAPGAITVRNSGGGGAPATNPGEDPQYVHLRCLAAEPPSNPMAEMRKHTAKVGSIRQQCFIFLT
jgi:hypothetical protein